MHLYHYYYVIYGLTKI